MKGGARPRCVTYMDDLHRVQSIWNIPTKSFCKKLGCDPDTELMASKSIMKGQSNEVISIYIGLLQVPNLGMLQTHLEIYSLLFSSTPWLWLTSSFCLICQEDVQVCTFAGAP